MFRLQSFTTAPWASVFIHWLIGMVYVFYFASFVILLREVLRPGVLWFLRNLNDPDFNPIQEMIHLSIPRHMRRYSIHPSIRVTNQYLKVLRLPGDVRHFHPGDVVHPGEVHSHRLPHLPALHNSVAGDNLLTSIPRKTWLSSLSYFWTFV